MAKSDDNKDKTVSAGGAPENAARNAQNASGTNKADNGAKTAQEGQQPGQPQAQASAGTPCADMIKADHRRVDQLFKQFESAEDGQKDQLVKQICQELTIHTMLEEELFYPACRKAAEDEADTLDEAQVEHDAAKMLIEDLRRGRSGDQYRDAKVKVLAEEIRHHVQEEEKPRDGILAQAKARGVDTPELAQRLQQRKEELMQRADRLPVARPVSIGGSSNSNQDQERNMARQGPDRDDRGRFTSDDDDRGGRSMRGGGGGRDRDYDDDRRGGRGGGRGEGGWFGDSQGHSEAARRGWEERSYASRGRDDDDDRRGGGGRGRGEGGWFGDPEGHSEASRRGWENRDDYRSRGRDDDDDRRGGRGGSRGEGGWFGDPQGHSEASRRGWENRDDYRSRGGRDDDDDRRGGRGGGGGGGERGQGGWFGDSRGHAEAARRGWENRDDDRGRGRDDDDRGYRSRSRDDDDDDRRGGRSGGRGEGGWFGDSRGHAEAARRGWQDRR